MAKHRQKSKTPASPYLVQGLLRRRKQLEDELTTMATSPAIVAAVVRSRDGARRGEHYRAAHDAIRALESIDQVLYQVARIKLLPRPIYPGGERV